MSKKILISHIIALVLGLLGGFCGRDLTGMQEPAEKIADQVVDAVEKAPAPTAPSAPAPAPVVDAGAIGIAEPVTPPTPVAPAH